MTGEAATGAGGEGSSHTGAQADEDQTIRNAVVIVHGMGEQRPLDMLKGFIRTALTPREGNTWNYYYSRPAEVTKSFEARRYIARPLGGEPPKQCQTEVFANTTGLT